MKYILAVLAIGLSLLAQPPQVPPGQARKGLDVDRTIDLLLDDDLLLPATLSLPEGRYRFVIHNAFTSARLDLRIDDEKNFRVANSEMKALASRGELIVDLKKGNQIIYVAQRPKWRATIEVLEVKK